MESASKLQLPSFGARSCSTKITLSGDHYLIELWLPVTAVGNLTDHLRRLQRDYNVIRLEIVPSIESSAAVQGLGIIRQE
jgi:hypothetical protein